MSKCNFEELIDSDAFVADALPDDRLHEAARTIFAELAEKRTHVAVTSWTLIECATVLSYRTGQSLARAFLESVERSRVPTIHITEELQQEAAALYRQQEGRGTNMVDCGNAVVARRFSIPRIFSFDKFYKRLGLPTVR
jgi:predicted nucleic acid-binding protein